MVDLQLDIDSSLDEVARVGNALREHCRDAGVSDFESAMVELAVVEAVNNAITHGYQGRSGGRVGVALRVRPESIEADISDSGPPVDPSRLAPRPADDAPVDRASLSESGRGLEIIRGIFEDVTFERVDDQNRLRMSKRRTGDQP